MHVHSPPPHSVYRLVKSFRLHCARPTTLKFLAKFDNEKSQMLVGKKEEEERVFREFFLWISDQCSVDNELKLFIYNFLVCNKLTK